MHFPQWWAQELAGTPGSFDWVWSLFRANPRLARTGIYVTWALANVAATLALPLYLLVHWPSAGGPAAVTTDTWVMLGFMLFQQPINQLWSICLWWYDQWEHRLEHALGAGSLFAGLSMGASWVVTGIAAAQGHWWVMGTYIVYGLFMTMGFFVQLGVTGAMQEYAAELRAPIPLERRRQFRQRLVGK